jgi:hypothetical protein
MAQAIDLLNGRLAAGPNLNPSGDKSPKRSLSLPGDFERLLSIVMLNSCAEVVRTPQQ